MKFKIAIKKTADGWEGRAWWFDNTGPFGSLWRSIDWHEHHHRAGAAGTYSIEYGWFRWTTRDKIRDRCKTFARRKRREARAAQRRADIEYVEYPAGEKNDG